MNALMQRSGRSTSTHPSDTEHFLRHVAWPEEAQLRQDEYWGPRLRAERTRALLRRLALGCALLAAVALAGAAVTHLPLRATAAPTEQPLNP